MNETLPQERALQRMKLPKPDPAPAKPVEADSSAGTFEQAFLENWSRIYRLLLHLVGDPAEAEDLALETFLRLYRHPQPPKDGFNLGGWLHRVATNLGLHSIRSFQRRQRYELEAGKGALEGVEPAHPMDVLSGEDDRRRVRKVLGQMNERQASLLVLRYSGKTYKEIAAVLGVAPTSIGPLLLRAEREFEKRYRALTEEDR